MNEREKKLRKDFIKCLGGNSCGDVVDDLISVLKKDYVLVVKEDRYCSRCFHCKGTNMFGVPDYCLKHDSRIVDYERALNCDDYLSGSERVKESIGLMSNSLSGDLFYD